MTNLTQKLDEVQTQLAQQHQELMSKLTDMITVQSANNQAITDLRAQLSTMQTVLHGAQIGHNQHFETVEDILNEISDVNLRSFATNMDARLFALYKAVVANDPCKCNNNNPLFPVDPAIAGVQADETHCIRVQALVDRLFGALREMERARLYDIFLNEAIVQTII